MKTVETELPEQLYEQVGSLGEKGWFRDGPAVLSWAARGFLETHQAELMKEFNRDDVEWGLPEDE